MSYMFGIGLEKVGDEYTDSDFSPISHVPNTSVKLKTPAHRIYLGFDKTSSSGDQSYDKLGKMYSYPDVHESCGDILVVPLELIE